MNRSLQCALLLGCTAMATPAQVVLKYSWSSFNEWPSNTIPDANAAGITDVRTIIEEAVNILSVVVHFQAYGNFNGDLYLTLQHGSAFSVLLNRPGRSSENSFGYADSGFAVSFTDASDQIDIHDYQDSWVPNPGEPLTGSWQPDARIADPSVSLSSSPRTAFLSSFQGENVAGEWTLFAADLSSGGQTDILSWGLEITVVPEPDQIALVTAIGLSALAVRSRMRQPSNIRRP